MSILENNKYGQEQQVMYVNYRILYGYTQIHARHEHHTDDIIRLSVHGIITNKKARGTGT